MNRLGVLVDLSHVSDKTALAALYAKSFTSDSTSLQSREITEAPVIWSHSATRSLNNISRNVPDHVLDKIGRGHGKVDGVVMVK